jgi:signal transduction histidine kinase
MRCPSDVRAVDPGGPTVLARLGLRLVRRRSSPSLPQNGGVASTTMDTAARGRAAGWLATAVATALVVVAALASYLPVVREEPIPFDLRDPSRLATWEVAVEVGSAVLIAAGAWAIREQRPQVAVALAIAGAGALLPFWATWTWLPTALRAAVLAASPLSAAGIAIVALRWSTPPSARARHELRAICALVAAAILIHLLGYNPFDDPGCAGTCDDMGPLLGQWLSTHSAVLLSCLLTIVAAGISVSAIVQTARRSTPRPVLLAVACGAAAVMLASVLRWGTWAQVSPAAWHHVLEPLAVGVVGVVVAKVAVRTARTRAAVGRLVDWLSRVDNGLGPTAGAILGVHFAVPDDSGWVDAEGRDIGQIALGDEQVVLSDQGGPVLRLILAERADRGAVLAGLTPASRLALMNARLTALARAKQADVRRSQERIVAMSDAERRRIERDLHDGAQQRLVGASLHLRATVGSVDLANAHDLLRAQAHLQAALAQLRRLAHGLFPNVLADEGLDAALEDLASTATFPVSLEVRLRGTLRSDVAMAAYALVAATVASVERPTAATTAQASVWADEMVVLVRVAIVNPTFAQPPDLTDVADRVGAIGGRLTLSRQEPATFVAEAVLPCAS